MPSSVDRIIDLYEQMTSITKRQLEELKKPVQNDQRLPDMLENDKAAFEQQLLGYNALSLDLALIAQQVDQSVSELNQEELDQLREHALKEVQAMQLIGSQIESQLHKLQQQSSSLIGRVQKNRTVVRSYGGLDMIDSTPMYIDEKN